MKSKSREIIDSLVVIILFLFLVGGLIAIGGYSAYFFMSERIAHKDTEILLAKSELAQVQIALDVSQKENTYLRQVIQKVKPEALPVEELIPTPKKSPPQTRKEERMLALLNEQRSRLGIPPLVWSWKLSAASGKWAEELVQNCEVRHEKQTLHDEIIVKGAKTPEEAVLEWIESSGHLAIITDPLNLTVGCQQYNCRDKQPISVCRFGRKTECKVTK